MRLQAAAPRLEVRGRISFRISPEARTARLSSPKSCSRLPATSCGIQHGERFLRVLSAKDRETAASRSEARPPPLPRNAGVRRQSAGA